MKTNSGIVGKGMVAVLAVVAAVAGGASYVASSWQQQAQQELVQRTVSNVFSNMAVTDSLDEVYQDADGDLIADLPEEPALVANPDELVFSFIASDDPANDAEVWKAATDAISAETGLPVRYVRLEDAKPQLAALRSGKIHITAFSSGTVPTAVNQAGFAPLCTIGNATADDNSGKFGYTMQFIVKADSPIKDLNGLRQKKIAFVRPRSNSGCKAAMILLLEKHNLQPERDYRWIWSYSHDASIAAVAAGDADAAPVASDVLARMAAKDEVQSDAYRVIYESERFPPVAFGCAHNLPLDLRESIRSALLELDWTDTRLAAEMAAGRSEAVPTDRLQRRLGQHPPRRSSREQRIGYVRLNETHIARASRAFRDNNRRCLLNSTETRQPPDCDRIRRYSPLRGSCGSCPEHTVWPVQASKG